MGKQFLAKLASCAFIAGGVSLMAWTGVCHVADMRALAREVQVRTVYERDDGVKASVVPEEDSEVVGEVLGTDSDMKVKKVVEYKDCLVIPRCGITAPIIEGTDSYALHRGIGHFKDTPAVGEVGNASYAGHYSAIYDCIFDRLPEIKMFDRIWGYDSNGERYAYYVTDKFIVEPDAIEVVGKIDSDGRWLTLVTCCNGGLQRFIVRAKIMGKSELKSAKREFNATKYQRMYRINDEIDDCREELNYFCDGMFYQ